MKKWILAGLLLSLAVMVVVRPATVPSAPAAPEAPTVAEPTKTEQTPVSARKWAELDDGSKSGTKISIDITSFEVITPEDIFEFIVMLEYAAPLQVDGESVVATVASVQISCKKKVVATVRDMSINEQQKDVLHNMLAKEFGIKPLEKGSHFGNIAEFVCTQGGAGPTKEAPKERDRRQAERDA